MRYAERRDLNQNELWVLAEQLGVWLTWIGKPVDCIACFRGKLTFVEIKGLKGKYAPSQEEFLSECQANNAPLVTWRTQQDVLDFVGVK